MVSHTDSRSFSALQKTLIITLVFGLPFGAWYYFTQVRGATEIAFTMSSNKTLEDGLVTHWTFDGEYVAWEDTGSEIKDRSGNGMHGDAQDNMNARSATFGVLGQAVTFDGSDDYVQNLDTTTLYPGSFAAWVRKEYQETYTGYPVLAYQKHNSSIGFAGLQFDQGSPGKVKYGVRNDSGTNTNVYTDRIDDGSWHHVVGISYSDSDHRIYLDGVLVSSSTVTVVTPITVNRYLVGGENGQYNLDADIDDVRFYNRALSADEVMRLYELGATTKVAQTLTVNPTLEDGLVGHWTFDGQDVDWASTTAEIKDRSGQGNHGNATGGMTPQSVTAGPLGQGMKFDGADYLEISDVAFDGEFSFSTWFKTANNSQTGIFFGEDTGTGGSPTPKIGIVSGSFFIRILNVTDPDTTVGVPAENDWHMLTVTRNSSDKIDVFVDGGGAIRIFSDNAQSGTYTLDTLAANGLINDQWYNGSLDDVRIYNRALSAEEVKRLYQLGATTYVGETLTTNPTLEDGLVGHWTFDGQDVDWASTTAEIKDRSGQGNHGDAQGGMTPQSVTAGPLGQGMRFDGVDDVIELSDDSLDFGDLDDMTMTAWFKGGAAGVNSALIVDARTYSGSAAGYLLTLEDISTDLRPRCTFQDGTAGGGDIYYIRGVARDPTYWNSGWHFVACTWDQDDASSTILYVDGADESLTRFGQISDIGSLENNDETGIGRRTDSTNYPFPGMIDDVRIYNRTLSIEELQRLYELGQ